MPFNRLTADVPASLRYVGPDVGNQWNRNPAERVTAEFRVHWQAHFLREKEIL